MEAIIIQVDKETREFLESRKVGISQWVNSAIRMQRKRKKLFQAKYVCRLRNDKEFRDRHNKLQREHQKLAREEKRGLRN